MVRGDQHAVVSDAEVRIRLGILGNASIPVSEIRRLRSVEWPWWGGIGVRLARRMVAFVTGSGRIALIELTEPLSVKTPFPWKTPRVAISVEDVDAFLNAVSQSSGVPVEPGIAAR